MINQLNEAIVMEELGRNLEVDDQGDDSDDNDAPPSGSSSTKNADSQPNHDQSANQRKLLLDATCSPTDIAYPTDLGLLNEAREKLEHIIYVLHAPHRGKKKKPRTYRQKARKVLPNSVNQRPEKCAKRLENS
ncbi:hypothetical protein GCM10007063_21040 [Lentibacillus kapialis]|uniref:Uncharacterized protein n=1 Tax=Lentibacillus kapialis TaxID=340214 RepID=A0A917PY89_9BACI|nr:hypothetical protein GCM10007063_21040 [Lentibacillus kapialis]